MYVKVLEVERRSYPLLTLGATAPGSITTVPKGTGLEFSSGYFVFAVFYLRNGGWSETFVIIRRYGTISKEAFINEEIRGKELRVIDTDGTQLGIMSRQEALDLAEQKKLDLVCIAPKAAPPVCRILDYGKYKYEMQKREKENRKKQKTTQIKEIRLMVGEILPIGGGVLGDDRDLLDSAFLQDLRFF